MYYDEVKPEENPEEIKITAKKWHSFDRNNFKSIKIMGNVFHRNKRANTVSVFDLCID
jgi:hypothetical protein